MNMDSYDSQIIEDTLIQISSLPEKHDSIPYLLLRMVCALRKRGMENDDREDYEFALCQLDTGLELSKQNPSFQIYPGLFYDLIADLIETKYQGYKSFWQLGSSHKIDAQEVTKDISRLSESLDSGVLVETWKFQGLLGIMVFNLNRTRPETHVDYYAELEKSILLLSDSIQSYTEPDYLYPFITRYFFHAKLTKRDGHDDIQVQFDVAKELEEISPFLTDDIQRMITTARNARRFEQGDDYFSHYYESHNLEYLDLAIDFFSSLDIDEDNEAEEAARQSRIAECLRTRHRVTSSDQDLEIAVELARNVAVMDVHSSQRVEFIYKLAQTLMDQYQRSGNLALIEESIGLLQTARHLHQESTTNPILVLRCLGNCFHILYMRRARQEDLDQALSILEEAIAMDGWDDLKYTIKGEMAALLSTAYLLKNDIATLDRAIELGEEAASFPQYGQVKFLSMLSEYYLARYIRLGDLDDLERLVEYSEKALAVTPKTHMIRPGVLSGICQAYTARYRRFRQSEDIVRAETAIKEAIDLTPEDLLPSVEFYSTLGNTLQARYKDTQDIRHLDAAIEAFQKRYETHNNLDWFKSMVLGHLAGALGLRAKATGNKNDLDAFKKHMLEAVEFTGSPPALRLDFAHQAVTADLSEPDPAWKDKIVRSGLELLSLACALDLPHDDQQHIIRSSTGLAAYGCSLSLHYGRPEEALERVEHGRGMILGHLIDRNDDLASLREQHPTLAAEYDDLRQEAFEASISSQQHVAEASLGKKRGAFSALQDCEDEIRKMKNFEWFHRGSPAEELKKVADQGPIIIVNVTEMRSDALIVTQDDVSCVPLIGMDVTTTSLIRYSLEMSVDIEDILPTSDRTVEPEGSTLVLEHLGFCPASDSTPRVWWIGSGAANGLPFHAAGLYQASLDIDRSPSCLDCVTSSYTPTIKALQYARLGAGNVQLTDKLSLVLISMATTPGQSDLPGVKAETDAVKSAINSHCNFTALEQPTAQQVLQHSQQAQLVHFACHGFADHIDPSQSHLLLQKRSSDSKVELDRLTVEALLDVKSQGNSWIVYLSACATAKARVQELGDESLHLATAFQIAGFPHAVGSLWAVDDNTCAEISQDFYQKLVSSGLPKKSLSVAGILQQAVQKIRSQHPYNPSLWAPFVHYGI
ncbi:tpr domain-containing [Fusarium longipes]|uniref:Tpr domain-containing n=1 Tax=Fusarium longipes TaxID=694270 RepID=A0A395S5S6_9HYPO|nr:tpr domain-containing [Fusarium longipes]